MKNDVKNLFSRLYQNPHELGNMLGYKYLTKEHSRWIRYIYLGEKDSTLLAFRGSFKTTAISVVGTIWYLIFNPDHRVLIASSTLDNAKKILQEIKSQYYKANLIELYSLANVLDPKDMSWWRKESIALSTKVKTSKEGNVEAVGALTVITSRHYDKIICDDLVVLKDRVSRAERERKKDWVRELQSIIEPTGTISYVGTPWHPEDVYSITPKPVKFPVGTVFNPKLTTTRLKEIRRMQGEVFYSSQYELNHVASEERILDNPNFGEYIPINPNEHLKRIAYLDPAFGGEDFSAITIGHVKNNKLYVVYGEVWRGQIDKTYNRTEKLYIKNNLFKIYVESNAAQRLITYELKSRGMRVGEVNNVKNKHLRIMDSVKKNWDKIIFSNNVSDEYLRQILDYSEDSEHDDAIDSLAGLCGVTISKKSFGFMKIGANGKIA